MTIKSITGIFAVTIIGLLGIRYVFVAPENLPIEQTITFVIVGVLVAVLTGFFAVAACAYMAGLVGSSSSHISGIGILSIIIFALCDAFNIFELPKLNKFATAIFIASIILMTACISNDNVQDLKRTFDRSNARESAVGFNNRLCSRSIHNCAGNFFIDEYIYMGIFLGVIIIAVNIFLRKRQSTHCRRLQQVWEFICRLVCKRL